MRILVVAAWPPWPLTDGGSLVLHHQLVQLGERHDITVLAAAKPPGASVPRAATAGVPDAVTIEWFGADRRGAREYARRRWGSLRTGEPADVFRVEVPDLLGAFDEQLRTRRPDVVQLHGWGTAQFARRSPVPSVHMAIDAWETAFGTQMVLPAWRRALEAGQRRKVVRHEERHHPQCFAVAVVAPNDADVLRRRSPEARIEVVPNGVEVVDTPIALGADPIIGFHGTLSTGANHEAAMSLVVDVLPRVQRTCPDARAMVIGRDPAPALQAQRRPDVVVTGEVDDARRMLQSLAVYVAPMASGTGLKNKVLEAMDAGLPVVASSLALNGIGDGPGVVVADTATAQADAVIALLGDPARREELGRAGRERVRRDFTWEASAARLEALWREAAG